MDMDLEYISDSVGLTHLPGQMAIAGLLAEAHGEGTVACAAGQMCLGIDSSITYIQITDRFAQTCHIH